MRTSARNMLCGKVRTVTDGAVNAEVVLDIGNGLTVTAIVTRESVAELGLAAGREALALIKASFVILAPGAEPVRTSARNRLPGVVIRLSPRGFGETSADGEFVRAGTAALDKRVAETAAAANIGGLEFYFGIPGTIGGALRMNAGANGGETKDVLIEATGIGRDGTKHVFDNAGMKFEYRNSKIFPSVIFTSARFRGRIETPEKIRARMAEVQNHRETAQPIREKTGGSTFKNPPGHSAWKLIDAAGCRGLRVGGAQVSEMHCNFLINTGNATGHDIETLGETVRTRVKENSGIELQWEIKRIGISGTA